MNPLGWMKPIGVAIARITSFRVTDVLAHFSRRILIAALSILSATSVIAATNVVEYTYDAVGNITNIQRQVTPGFAITSFSPTSGSVGSSVTISGAGFSPTPGSNTVKFNGTAAVATASSSSSITTTVPSGATTGRISLAVGASTVTSSQDFVVTIPGAPTITSFTPAFGAATDVVSVTGTGFATGAGATTVMMNSTVATATVGSTTTLSFPVPANTASGRISATTSVGTGTSALDFLVAPPGILLADIATTVHLVAGAGPTNVAVGTASKHALILFDGVVDTYYTMQFGQFAESPTSAALAYKIVKPDNTVLSTGTIGNTSRPTIHLPKLPTTGTYSVVVSVGNATLNANVSVAADPIVLMDGVSVTTALNTPYQSARLVFDATAGQRIDFGVMSATVTPNNTSMGTLFTVYLPNGTAGSFPSLPYCYAATIANPQGNCDGEMTATVAGTYTVIAQNALGYYANFAIQMNSEVTGTLAPDVPQDVTLTRVGQDARYAFTASVGDSVGLDISAITPLPQAQSFFAYIYRPDGSLWTSCFATAPNAIVCDLGTIATAGTYSIVVDPSFGAYGSFKLTLKQGPLLSTGDAATAFAPAAIPESARFRFAGTAGQNFSLGVESLVYIGTNSSPTSLYVYRPDRSQLGSYVWCYPSVASGRCKMTLANLPVTGTYSVALVPPPGVKMTGSINLSSDIGGVLAAGTPQTINASRAGQNARLTFSGTTGDSTSIKLFGLATTPSSQPVVMTVFKPDGGFLSSASTSTNSSAFVNLASLPATGTYTVLGDSTNGITWQGQLALDPGVLLAIDGTTGSLSTSAGEALRFRLPGTAGQRLEIGLSGLAYGASNSNPTSFTLYRPDGASLTTMICYTAGAGSCETVVASLPTTGTYSVVLLSPSGSSIGAGTVAFSTALAGAFVVGDPPQTIAITRPGQSARYTFSGISSQLLRVTWAGTTVSGSASVAVSVLKPDGSTLSSGSFLNGATSGFDVASLPSTGSYTLVFDPAAAATMSAPISLVTR